jgi:hypothetical protein
MEKQQRRINAQYNEDRHELETAVEVFLLVIGSFGAN